jgi:hypothetical protein
MANGYPLCGIALLFMWRFVKCTLILGGAFHET